MVYHGTGVYDINWQFINKISPSLNKYVVSDEQHANLLIGNEQGTKLYILYQCW